MRVPLLYKDVPQFGFDLGSRTVKVVQLRRSAKGITVQGYGMCYFSPEAMVEGIVVDPKIIAKELKVLMKKMTVGNITAGRAIVGLPATKLFTRTLELPPMEESDLKQAINYEAEQYIPVPVSDLYIDYEVVRSATKENDQTSVLMIAAPRAIVDSYIRLFDELGIGIGAIEANMTAVVRALLHSGDAGGSTLVMDIGSNSTDLTIYDKYIPLSGSIPVGGDNYTDALVKNLSIKVDQANEIKVKFGIAKSGMQEKVRAALEPQIEATLKEAKRVIHFYESRSEQHQTVKSVVISGGTAGMPGIGDYIRTQLALPLSVANPWKNIIVGKNNSDSIPSAAYTAAVGLALRGLL